MQIIFFIISILVSIYINLMVFQDKYSPVLIYWWLLSIIFMIIFSVFRRRIKINFLNRKFSKKYFFLFLIILLPAIIRIMNYIPNRFHGDDLMTAYFSATHDFTKINFFSGIPQDKVQWVSQFPTMFFALQRIFFIFFGETLLSVKLSVIPYVIVISLMLFLIVRAILNIKTAVIAVVLYAFFAVSIYHETTGLHFISSTAVFMVFFYFAILQWKNNNSLFGMCINVNFIGARYPKSSLI